MLRANGLLTFFVLEYQKNKRCDVKKTFLCILLLIAMLATSFTSCQKHEHAFSAWETVKSATCSSEGTEKRVCSCGEEETRSIQKNAHTWEEATCTKAKTCSVCGLTEGSPLGHDWKEATCTEPKTCKVCGEKEGSSKGHKWEKATCTKPKHCTVCGATEGVAEGHSVNSNLKCSKCGAKLTAKDLTYYAGSDFRSIRRKYSSAKATDAYVLVYKNKDGHNCVMVVLFYKIIKNYNVAILHDLATGDTIEDPMSYYNKMADRYYGANKTHYWDLATEAGEYQVKALKALQNIWKGGSDNGGGAYVGADYLNM